MTFVPVEVFPPATPAIAESFDHPTALGLLGDLEVFETNACPWPQVSTLVSAMVAPAKAGRDVARLAWDIVDEWGDQSFPASDPPANW